MSDVKLPKEITDALDALEVDAREDLPHLAGVMTGREMAERAIATALRTAATRRLRRPVTVKRNDIIAFEVLPAGAPSKEELARALYALVNGGDYPGRVGGPIERSNALLGRVPKEWLRRGGWRRRRKE